MKKQLFILIFAIAGALSASAQSAETTNECSKEQQQARRGGGRAARIAQNLALDDATTAKFIAVYDRCTADMRAAQKKYARIHPEKGEGKAAGALTDEQVKTNIENQFALSQATLDIRKKYYAEYQKILTPKQIQRLYSMEKKGAEAWRRGHGPRSKGGAMHKGQGKQKRQRRYKSHN